MADQYNPFESAEPWTVSAENMLDVGPHVVTIETAEDDTAKSSGNPVVHLKFVNSEGSIQAWEAYHAEFLRKIVSLYNSVGLPLPANGEFNPMDRCRLTEQKIAQLRGKQVGIVVRDEPDNRLTAAPGATQRKVAGYLPPHEVTNGPDTRGLPDAQPTQQQRQPAQDKIPF